MRSPAGHGRHPRRLPILVALVAAVSACSTPAPPITAGPTPTSTSSPPTTTPTPSRSTSPTTPTDEEQAIKAVERFYTEFNKAALSLDTKGFRAAFKPGCLVCESAANKLDSMALAKHRATSGVYTVSELSLDTPSPNPRILRLVGTVSNTEIVIKDLSGKIVEQEAPWSGRKYFSVFRTDDGAFLVSGVV